MSTESTPVEKFNLTVYRGNPIHQTITPLENAEQWQPKPHGINNTSEYAVSGNRHTYRSLSTQTIKPATTRDAISNVPLTNEVSGVIIKITNETIECRIKVNDQETEINFSPSIFPDDIRYGDHFKLFLSRDSGYKMPIIKMADRKLLDTSDEYETALNIIESWNSIKD